MASTSMRSSPRAVRRFGSGLVHARAGVGAKSQGVRGGKNHQPSRWAHPFFASGRDTEHGVEGVKDTDEEDGTRRKGGTLERNLSLDDMQDNTEEDGVGTEYTETGSADQQRERDRMIFMSTIRAKMTPAVSGGSGRDQELDDQELAIREAERNAIEKQLTRAAARKRDLRRGKGRSNGNVGANYNDDDDGDDDRRSKNLTWRDVDTKYDTRDTSSLRDELSSSTRPGRDPGALTRFVAEKKSNAKKNAKTLFGVFGENELKEVAQLAVPALGSLLADPLMSLIDTAAVGRHGSTSLAALGPNTAVFQIVFQLFSFLSITTTGMVARACAEGDTKTVRRALANATLLALGFGSAVCVGLNVFADDVLRLMGCSAELTSAAAPYLKIRALAIPAVLFATSAQGGCLGQQDSKTPLRIFLAAGVINVLGDLCLVGNMGVRGAAYATLAAQWYVFPTHHISLTDCPYETDTFLFTFRVSAFLFFKVLSGRKMLPEKVRVVLYLPNPNAVCPYKTDPAFRLHSQWSHWRLPTAGELQNITKISGMLLLGSLCRMGVYTLMTTTAIKLGTLTMAAHQVALQIFWTLTCVLGASFPNPGTPFYL